MTRNENAFWAALEGVGIRQLIAWAVAVLIAAGAIGATVGAMTAQELALTNARTDVRQDSTIARLKKQVDNLASSVERIADGVDRLEYNSCLTLAELRGDETTDRCRRQ